MIDLEHMRRIQSRDVHQSVSSLSMIMPVNIALSVEVQEEDKQNSVRMRMFDLFNID